MFSLTMTRHTTNPKTGSRDVPVKVETKTFEKAEDLSAWWESGKKDKLTKKQRKSNLKRKVTNDIGHKIVDELIASAQRSVGG